MIEKNRHIFENTLQQIPKFKADDRIWDKIEEELDKTAYEKNAGSLKEAIGRFPSFRSEENNWKKIEKAIYKKPRIIQIRYLFKVAASLIIIAGASFFFRSIFKTTKEHKQEAELTFSRESFPENTNVLSDEYDSELNNLIQLQCSAQPAVCANSEFVELTRELSDLTQSLSELEKSMNNTTCDPETYKYILRAQKGKAEISKKLIQYLNS